MAAQRTFIAPGQRFARLDQHSWHAGDQLTILQVGRDALGLTWVTYRDQDGEDLTGPAVWFEAAVAAGEIIPVVAGGFVAQC